MNHSEPLREEPQDIHPVCKQWGFNSTIIKSTISQPKPLDQIPQFEPETEFHSMAEYEDIERVLDFLLLGMLPPSDLLARYRTTLLVGPSAAMLQAFRAGLSRRLLQIWQEMHSYQAKKTVPSQAQTDWWQLKINNILSYLTYAESPTGACIEIPQYIDSSKQWDLVSYEITRLQLTPGWLGSPYYAYGLTSKHTEANSLLLFMGTTYPGGNGFLWTLLADMTPFMSVGSLLFRFGKKVLKKWVREQGDLNKKIDCHGQSLGGALSLLAADSFKDKGLRSYALVPAGTFGPIKDASNVTVIFGGSDPICQVGDMPEGARFIYVCPSEKQADTEQSSFVRMLGIRGMLYSHMAGLSWQSGATAYEVDRAMIAQKPGKKIWTYLWYATWILSPFLWAIKVLSIAVYPLMRGLCAVWRRVSKRADQTSMQREEMLNVKKRAGMHNRGVQAETCTSGDEFERILTYCLQQEQDGDTSTESTYICLESSCKLTTVP